MNDNFKSVQNVYLRAEVEFPQITTLAAPSKLSSSTQIKSNIRQEIEKLFEIGVKDPDELLALLANDSILSTNKEDRLQCIDREGFIETNRQFNVTLSKLFKGNDDKSWILYQHLRKAGGTGFCELAKSNMKRKEVPPYYCMPDNKGSLATPPWDQEAYLLSQLYAHGYRIASNEWDSYQSRMGGYAGAVLVTTLRNPIDRWYSQYKFEHLERRDGSAADAPRRPFITWYRNNYKWMMTNNYYVKTFMGTEDPAAGRDTRDFYWTYVKFRDYRIRWEDFDRALESLRRFHLVLIMEWLDDPLTIEGIRQVLGWACPPRKVRPHEMQAPNREQSNSSVLKGSSALALLPPGDYQAVARDNALDMLFYHAARRMALERYACRMYED